MELRIKDGDYVFAAPGGLERLSGKEELLQRILFKLRVRRGSFPFLPELGSQLHLLGRENVRSREAAAKQYVAQALADEDVTVDGVTLTPCVEGGMELRAALSCGDAALQVQTQLR